jgi:hypothetical protein
VLRTSLSIWVASLGEPRVVDGDAEGVGEAIDCEQSVVLLTASLQ